ncbi:MAG: response regulator, partial [Moraxellaceae bacterium]
MDSTDTSPEPAADKVAAASDASREQTRILVVDDDVRLRNLLQRFLEEQGYTVKAVPDAVQMDRLLARELFALMVLDLMLPGEDGMAICRR